MIQSFDIIQLLTASLNKRLANSDIIHLEEQPACNRCRSWMQTGAMKICWKLRIPGCRRADPKQLRQPAGAGEHDGALSIRALGSTHYTARSTGFESCSPHSRNHLFQDNGLKNPSQSNNRQQNNNAKSVYIKLWIYFLITGDWSNFFIHIAIPYTTHLSLLGWHLCFGGKWNSLRLQGAIDTYFPA